MSKGHDGTREVRADRERIAAQLQTLIHAMNYIVEHDTRYDLLASQRVILQAMRERLRDGAEEVRW